MTGGRIHFRYVRFYLAPDGHKQLNEPVSGGNPRVRWVSVGFADTLKIEPAEPLRNGDRGAALAFAKSMANELVSMLKPRMRPQHEQVRWLATGYAAHFLSDWNLWHSQFDRGTSGKRQDWAVEWLSHMIEHECSNPVYRRALALILNILLRDRADIPAPLREWDLVAALAPPTPHGSGDRLVKEALREDWNRRVGAIVGLMAENQTLRAARVRATRRRESPPHSICDVLAEALTKTRQPTTFDGVRHAWEHYQRLPAWRATFFDSKVD